MSNLVYTNEQKSTTFPKVIHKTPRLSPKLSTLYTIVYTNKDSSRYVIFVLYYKFV